MQARAEQLDVLVVDADASVGGLLLAVLRRAGLRAAWVGDASTLFAALCAADAVSGQAIAAPHLLLAERSLPGCDVTQLQELLLDRGLSIPLLVTCAYLEPEARAALCDAPGVAGLLEKPFDLKRLGEDVLAALQLAGARQQGSPAASEGGDAAQRESGASRAWFPGGSRGLRTSDPDQGAEAC
ncbi:MAG: hypothetical protein DHS20C15_21280 [Planctomycetota bacterium]|nr:MAG: hypothetical protein DHS20C15_21280 [Planctomycetota bacterium]